MRLMLVQYAGDYLEAYQRLQESGAETYYGHRYVLEQLARIGHDFGEAAVLCCMSSRPYDVTLPTGVRVMGATAHAMRESRAVTRLIGEYDPTHLVLHSPMRGLIRWGVRTERRVACLFADSFNDRGLKRLLKYGPLARLLNDRGIEWVANHGVNACLSLAGIGVARGKIIPWDWPYIRQPDDAAAKTGPGSGVQTLVYAGTVSEQKGVGDVVAAVAELKRRGVSVVLKVAGPGEIPRFEALARRLNIGSDVQFLGVIANDAVLQLMRQASIVVVPSRHDYPEGLPLTIYEALCSRTPIVASDHPMFARRLVHRTSAMIYPAGQPMALAASVEELLADQGLYRSLSAAAQSAWEGLQIPVKWGDLLYRWIADQPEDRRWLLDHRLESGRYASQLGET